MGDPNGPTLQLPVVLAALTRHEAEFVLVGGQAGSAHGAQRLTTDLDIVVRWTPANLDRVGHALADLGAGLRVEGLDEPFTVPDHSGAFLGTLELSTWRSSAGDVDVLRFLPSPTHDVGYDELRSRASVFTVAGTEVLVADLKDVIASKETVDRPSDREALPELRRLALEEQQRRRPPSTP